MTVRHQMRNVVLTLSVTFLTLIMIQERFIVNTFLNSAYMLLDKKGTLFEFVLNTSKYHTCLAWLFFDMNMRN